MKLEVVMLPSLLMPRQVQDRTVVVFDVLRATTTMTAAIAAGVKEIRIFADHESASGAAKQFGGSALLCGERNCLPPPGFELGNSPGAFSVHQHAARTIFMCTTNGTRAILAAQGAVTILIGALVSARATANKVKIAGTDVTLLCAGTDGQIALEDLIGAGAVIDHLLENGAITLSGDAAVGAHRLFLDARSDLHAALAATHGGRNVINAGLSQDVAFAAQLNRYDFTGKIFVRDV